jgi:hypothetical protein
MNKFVILFLLISTSLFAQEESTSPINQDGTPVMTTEAITEDKVFNPRKSHWLTTFGFEGMKYEVPAEYNGVQEDFKPYDQEFYGGRLGVGGEIYLGLGFNTTTKVEGFYVGTLFSRVLNAGPQDEAQEFAYIKRTGSIWGVEALQSIGLVFDFKTKNPFLGEWAYMTIEPFVEAGIGRARAYNRLAYEYNTGASGTNEGYRKRIRDELSNVKLGGGINFTSSTGYFLYLKAHVNKFDILERKTTTYSRPDQGNGTTITESIKNAKMDPITTYAIGGGYKF